MPSVLVDTRPNWSRSRRTSSWRLALTDGALQQATRSFLSFSRCSLIRWAQVWLDGRRRTAHLAIEKLSFPLLAMEQIATTAASICAITIRAASLVALE